MFNRRSCWMPLVGSSVVLLALALMSTPAQATLIVDVRATEVLGGSATIVNPHSVDVLGMGATIKFDVWALVSGGDASSDNDGLSQLWGGLSQTVPAADAARQIVGTFQDPGLNLTDSAFMGAGWQPGHPTMTTTLPPAVSRIGGTTGNWWNPISANPVKTYQPGAERHVGSFIYTVDGRNNPAAAGPATQITFFRGTTTSNAWYEDDVLKNMGVGSGTYVLTPVTLNAIVPEPSTLVLLGMAGCALLAIRLRKKED
jgi:hypothetical protein